MIQFTQYLRPNGRTQTIHIEMDEETEKKAAELIESGAVFEAEVLSNGIVSLECLNTAVDEDDPRFYLSARLVENGPAVVSVVKTLVEDAYKHMFRKKD